MIDKQPYLNILTTADQILSKYDFYAGKCADNIKDISAIIDDYKFRVILTGGFSSGKSALLNKLVGKTFFEEDQSPSTSVPAEVSYAPVDSAYIVQTDGQEVTAALETVTAQPPQNTAYIAMNLNAPFFKDRPELILVDFPGYDSNVEAHDKAINAYLQKGAAFIVLIPAQQGTLKTSDIKFIKEAANYPQCLSCLISKSDLVPQENLKEVTDFIGNKICSIYHESIPCIAISTRKDSDTDFVKNMASIVDSFSPQVLFDYALTPQINTLLQNCSLALSEYMQATQLDVKDIEKQINQASDQQYDLEVQLKKENRNLEKKYQNEIVPQTMDQLQQALENNLDALASAALSGEQSFSSAVQSILRPVLISIPGTIQANVCDVVSAMNFNFSSASSVSENNNERSDAMLQNIISIVSQLPILGNNQQNPTIRNGKTGANSNPSNSITTAISIGLCAIVSRFNPVIAILTTFLPSIFSLFTSGNSKQQQQPAPRQQAREQVQAVIPQILSTLQPQVEQAMLETKNAVFEEIQHRFNESITTVKNSLESAKQEKDKLTAEYQHTMENMQKDLDALNALLINK